MRFLLYSHDGLGLGHTRRHIAVARALTELTPKSSILIVTGADEVNRLGLPEQVEVLKLPGLQKLANDSYGSRRLRISVEEIRSLRADLLLTTVKSFRPSVVLVDKHPFGAKGEFRAALEAARAIGARTALGFRDILDDRTTVLQEWAPYNMLERIDENYDQVLIYGDRAVFDPIAEYQFPENVAAKTSFCGYIVNPATHKETNDAGIAAIFKNRSRPIVLATPGGGEDGFALLENFIQAATNAPWQGVVVSGPMIPETKLEKLHASAATSGIPIFTFLSDLSGLFPSIDALVCMGGYNTLAESAFFRVPTICVPRVYPRSEQLIRAECFERLGLLRSLHPEKLNSQTLQHEIQIALHQPRQKRSAHSPSRLHFDGAKKAAQLLLQLAHQQVESPEKIIRLVS
ncbi:MAG: glycosyltransferase [Verrucomicrobiota bacterium]